LTASLDRADQLKRPIGAMALEVGMEAMVADTEATVEDMEATPFAAVDTVEDTVTCTAVPRRDRCIPTRTPP
jgi:hypothetical protein